MSQLQPIPRRPTPKEIKSIFPSAIATGIILPELGLGLHIEFARRTDFFKELGLLRTARNFFSRKLCTLTNQFGFVNLKHCAIPEIENNGGLSYGKDNEGRVIQDPFHRDWLASRPDFLTVIHRQALPAKEIDEGRVEPTYYALEEDIRTAISQLPTDGLSEEVVRALSEMQEPDYRFRLYDADEMPARRIIQCQYPNFVTDVFDLIPAGRKFVKHWLPGVWDMVAHANQSGSFLHARASGHKLEDHEMRLNPLRGLEIYPG